MERMGAVSRTEMVVDGIAVASAGGSVVKTVVGSELAVEKLDGEVALSDTVARALDAIWLGMEGKIR